MNWGWRRVLATVLPIALAVLGAVRFSSGAVAIKTSLYDLFGERGEMVPESVRRHSANVVPVMVESSDLREAQAAARALAARLGGGDCRSVRLEFGDEAFSAMLELYKTHRAGLASPRDMERLRTPEGRASIARAAIRKFYSSPVPPLFSPADDPFCLADGFITSLPFPVSGWMMRDGVLVAEHDGVFSVLVVLELDDATWQDTERLIDFHSRLSSAIAEVGAGHRGVSFKPCGVPLHTAAAASKSKREIGYLTVFSFVFIIALSFVVFRSFSWVLYVGASLLAAAGAGALAVSMMFDSIHLMTIVLGTTVLGLVVDYSFHWMLREETRRDTARNLFISFATTEISLVPLALSSLPVLRESAVFLGSALVMALAFVLVCYPERTVEEASDGAGDGVFSRMGRRIAWCFIALVGAAALVGWSRISFKTDPQALYCPEPELAEAEALFAKLSGSTNDYGFLVVEAGDDLESSLEKEASILLPDSVPRLSRYMPPFSTRLETASFIGRLYEEQGEKQKSLLGLETLSGVDAPAPWRRDDVPRSLARAYLVEGALIAASVPRPEGELPNGALFVAPRKVLSDVLSSLASETLHRLGFAVAMMFAALVVFCRRRALKIAFPPVFSLAVVAGILTLSGENVNLFHLLAGFLLVGMGVDYAVFLQSSGRRALKPALCSLLTSMAGFGALVFVSFPVVKAFGAVMGLGLFIAFTVACAMSTGGAAKSASGAPATEHGATIFGMEILYLCYRILGLRFLHLLASGVGLCVWMFSRPVRKASPSPAKIVAFTQSLADKLVVMAGGSRVPVVEMDGSADSKAFLEDVSAGRGVFILSSHCGTIEALAAYGETKAKFHAWMEFERTSVFNKFYTRHAKRTNVVIHPISDFGPETAFFAADALDDGDCLVMAGDRTFGRKIAVSFGTGEIELAQGAFRFAGALGHHVYFIACVATGGCRYKAIVRRLPDGVAEMIRAYAQILSDVVEKYPDQWFMWEGVTK